MSNPFMYDDPTLKTLDSLNKSLGTVGTLMHLKSQADYQQEHNRLQGQQQEMMRPYYQALARKAQAAVPVSTDPWDAGNLTRMKAKLQLQGVPVDQLRFLKELEPLAADQNVKYGDVASAVSNDWDRHRGGITEDLGVHASKLAAKAALLQPNDPERTRLLDEVSKIAKIQSAFDQLPQAKVKEILFPDIHHEEINSKAAIVDQQTQARQAIQELKNRAWQSNVEQRIQAQKEINDAKLAMQEKLNEARKASKEKSLTTLDTKRLSDMISNATEGGKKDPSASDIELIGIEAAKHGYEFKPVTTTVKNKFLPDSQETKWQLVPKSGGGGATISTEQDLRKHLKDNGASDAYINEYVKRARKAGKI